MYSGGEDAGVGANVGAGVGADVGAGERQANEEKKAVEPNWQGRAEEIAHQASGRSRAGLQHCRWRGLQLSRFATLSLAWCATTGDRFMVCSTCDSSPWGACSPIRLCLRGSYFFVQRNCGPLVRVARFSAGFLRVPRRFLRVPRWFPAPATPGRIGPVRLK